MMQSVENSHLIINPPHQSMKNAQIQKGMTEVRLLKLMRRSRNT